jgi:chromosome partitioning protein
VKVWTVANQKGGVGKTTTTVSLGGLLAQQNANVLLIDTDPHASLSYYFGIDCDDAPQGLYDVFTAHQPLTKKGLLDCICPTQLKSLFVLPASMALSTLDRKLGNQNGMGLILKRAMALIEGEFEYVIIDCPPVLGVLMVNALAASTRVVIPVQTEFLALKGLDRMLHSLAIMEKPLNKHFAYTIVPTMFDKRVRAGIDAYRILRENHGDKVWQGLIPIDTKFRDASSAQTTPSVYAPKSRGVIAYTSLLRHLRLLEVQL